MKKKPFLKRWLIKFLGSIFFYSTAFAIPQNLSELMIIAETQFDSCCLTLNSKIDEITQLVNEDFTGTFSVIASINCTDNGCEATSINSATNISSPGKYCLSQNITGNITINSSNVALNLNSFNVNGTIFITSNVDKAIISNGSIKTSNPLCLSNNGANVIIENIVMLASPGITGAAGSEGQSSVGINNNGSFSIIKNCKITTGAGGTGGAGNPYAGKGGSSIGIHNAASFTEITECVIRTANAGAGGMGANGFSGDTGGIGGDSIGIMNTIDTVKIVNCSLFPGNGGAGAAGSAAQVVSGDTLNPGANGGNSIGINNNSNNIKVIGTIINCQNGGSGGTAGGYIRFMTGSAGGNGGNSTGILNSGNNVLVLNCNTESGTGGFGGNGTFAIDDPLYVISNGGPGGNGGSSFGIFNSANNNDIVSMQIIRSTIKSTFGGDGGLGGVASGLEDPVRVFLYYGLGGPGGNGGVSAALYNNLGNNILVQATRLVGGPGGNGNTGGGGAPGAPGGVGANSYGIYNLTSHMLCQKNIIESSNGGNGGMGGTVPDGSFTANGGPGGNGGNSIIVHLGNNNGKVRNCTLDKAGSGGVGGQGGLTSSGGQPGGVVGPDGADGNSGGIEIDPSVSFSQINNCFINNVPGSGFGIYDASIPNSSMIFSNYAFNVQNPYVLAMNNAIDSPNGSAFALGTDRLANLHQP